MELDTTRIIINHKNMLEFLEDFDPVQRKYGLEYGIRSNKMKKEDREKYRYLERLESIQQHSDLTRITYGESRESLDMIYDRRKVSDDIMKMYDLIKNKIIIQYINIEGLERLFNDKYIEFEWEMHLGIDYKKHSMDYYRDHFVHQMRNAYCMDVFLRPEKAGGKKEREGLDWCSKIMEILQRPTNSKVSRYVYNSVEQQKLLGTTQEIRRYAAYLAGKDGCENYELKNLYGNEAEEKDKNQDENEFYYINIIYMSCYMAALFHDIGYPEVSNSQNQKRMIEYIANLYNTETSGYNYARLRALMQNSLLFRLIPFEEIQGRMEKEKIDHGVLSAIIFLMNFYENGAIQRLEPYKRCAVELAALAMYDHTNQYSYDKQVEKNGYVRASFLLNPVSYLLRLCDDLQEWERVYFELSHASNLILCRQCKTPVVRKLEEKQEKYYYACNCNENREDTEGIFAPVFDYHTNFPYRRIYNVCVCKELIINTLELKKEEKGQKKVVFQLNYQLDRLLHVAYMNPSFARQRAKELKKLKNLLDYQFELPPMYLSYFVSANPVLIKTYILYQYFYERNEWENISENNENWKPIMELNRSIVKKMSNARILDLGYDNVLEQWREDFNEEYQNLEWQYEQVGCTLQNTLLNGKNSYNEEGKKDTLKAIADSAKGNVGDVLNLAVDLYIRLAVFMHLALEINHWDIPAELALALYEFNVEAANLDINKYCGGASDENKYYSKELEQLIADAIEQCGRMYHKLDIRKTEQYYNQFMVSDYTHGCIKRYTDVEAYKPASWLEKNELFVDAFTDLVLFKEILVKL